MKGLLIEEDVLELTFGRGDNAETYQVEKPEVDLEDAIELQEGPHGVGDTQYTQNERHGLLSLLEQITMDARRIIGQGEPVPASMTNNAGTVGVTAKFRKLYEPE